MASPIPLSNRQFMRNSYLMSIVPQLLYQSNYAETHSRVWRSLIDGAVK